MIVKFADKNVLGRCRAILQLNEIEYKKLIVKDGTGHYAQFLILHGFAEQLHPYKPINEWNSYRLTPKGVTMKKILSDIIGTA